MKKIVVAAETKTEREKKKRYNSRLSSIFEMLSGEENGKRIASGTES